MAVVFGSPSFVLEKEEKTSQEETKKYKRYSLFPSYIHNKRTK